MEKVVEGAVELPVTGVDAEPGRQCRACLEEGRGQDRRRHRRDEEQEPLPAPDQPGNQQSRNVFRHHREPERDPGARMPVPFVEHERDHEERGRDEIHVAAAEALHQEEGIPAVE